MTAEAFDYTDDRLLGGRVLVRQPKDGYRVAVDPVLLAAAVPAKAGDRVLDAGCGTGAAMFCLAARVHNLALTGIELQPRLADFARAALALNGLASARIVTGDVAQAPREFFDLVMTNPPFGADGTPPPEGSRAAAHMEGTLDLAGWIDCCLNALKPKGRLVMIHRADRLSEILALLHRRAGDAHVMPIFSKKAQPARRVIVDAGKGRKSPDVLLPGVVLHTETGGYTAEAEALLRDGRAIAMH